VIECLLTSSNDSSAPVHPRAFDLVQRQLGCPTLAGTSHIQTVIENGCTLLTGRFAGAHRKNCELPKNDWLFSSRSLNPLATFEARTQLDGIESRRRTYDRPSSNCASREIFRPFFTQRAQPKTCYEHNSIPGSAMLS
jgi:hypothetical protein